MAYLQRLKSFPLARTTLLVSIQLAAVSALAMCDWQMRQREQFGRKDLPARTYGGNMRVPAVGTQAPPLVVNNREQQSCVLVPGANQPQAVLFVGTCGPCSEPILFQYDRLWREGKRVVVVSAAPQSEVDLGVKRNGWRLPIYTEKPSPSRTPHWQVTWRPWVCVVRGSQVIYTQTPTDAWPQALDRVSSLLSSSATPPP